MMHMWELMKTSKYQTLFNMYYKNQRETEINTESHFYAPVMWKKNKKNKKKTKKQTGEKKYE